MMRALLHGTVLLWLVSACGDDDSSDLPDAGVDAGHAPLIEAMIDRQGPIWFENTMWADNQNLLRCTGCEYVGVVDLSTPGMWIETFYAVVPGSTGVGEGDRICSIEWQAGFSAIGGREQTDRSQVVFASSSNDCLPGIIETPPHVLAVAARDPDQSPTHAALWETRAGVGVADPFPGYNAGAWAVPLAPCPVGQRVPGRSYCQPLCEFDAPPCGAPAPP